MSDPTARPAVWMLAGSFAFAAMGACTHALGGRCDWLVVALIRAVFMFATCAGLARTAGVRLVVFEPPALWQRSLAGSLSLVCNFYALARLPVADAVTLSNAHPLWIVLLTPVLLHLWPTLGEVLGVACGLVGVALIQQPHLGGDRLAAGVALLSSASTALAMIGLHRLRGIDPRAIVAHFSGVATLIAGTWLCFRRGELVGGPVETSTLLLLLGVGLSGTAGQYCLTRAYSAGPPARLSAIGLVQVVFALGFDVAFWGRRLDPTTLAGFALVLAPTAWLSIVAGRRLSTLRGSATADPPGPGEPAIPARTP